MTTLPTNIEAIRYVAAIELSWGLPALIVSVGIDHDEMGDTVSVVTEDNRWSVWTQADGTLYGEC